MFHTTTPRRTAYSYQMQMCLLVGRPRIGVEYVRYVSRMIITGNCVSQIPPIAPRAEEPIISTWVVDPKKPSLTGEKNDNQTQGAKTTSWRIFSGHQRIVEHARLESNLISLEKNSEAFPFWTTKRASRCFTHQLHRS